MYGSLVDVQLEGIQKNIEDYLSAGRQSTFDADRVLDSQRNAVYELRRMVLVGGQQTLRGACLGTLTPSWTTIASRQT